MNLLAGERRHLDCIEGYLRAEDCHLASMFDVFTRLTRADGKPPAEGQYLADGPWREAAFAWQRLRRRVIVTAALLVAALLAVVVFSLT